jgi:hypothetical protein
VLTPPVSLFVSVSACQWSLNPSYICHFYLWNYLIIECHRRFYNEYFLAVCWLLWSHSCLFFVLFLFGSRRKILNCSRERKFMISRVLNITSIRRRLQSKTALPLRYNKTSPHRSPTIGRRIILIHRRLLPLITTTMMIRLHIQIRQTNTLTL